LLICYLIYLRVCDIRWRLAYFASLGAKVPGSQSSKGTKVPWARKVHGTFALWTFLSRCGLSTPGSVEVLLSLLNWLQVRQDRTRKKVTGPSITTAPPIKYCLGYRSRTRTLKLTLTLTLKVTKMYAVQNDTGITVNTVISKSYFRWAGGGYTKGPPPEGGIKLLQKQLRLRIRKYGTYLYDITYIGRVHKRHTYFNWQTCNFFSGSVLTDL